MFFVLLSFWFWCVFGILLLGILRHQINTADQKSTEIQLNSVQVEPWVPPQKVEPQSNVELAKALLQDISKEMQLASSYATQLEALEFSADLVNQMQGHSQKLHELYKKIQRLVLEECEDG